MNNEEAKEHLKKHPHAVLRRHDWNQLYLILHKGQYLCVSLDPVMTFSSGDIKYSSATDWKPVRRPKGLSAAIFTT